MTREEAVYKLKSVFTMCEFIDAYGEPIDSDIYYEALEVAIEALQQSDHIVDGDKKDDHFRDLTKKVDVISRQAAIDAVNTWFELYVINRTMADTMSVQDMLRDLPSAEPEIIRCKDCKYWREHKYAKETKRYIPFCGFNAIYTKSDDFCSRAVMKGE